MIERRQYTNAGCRRIHSALTDVLVPFKYYAAELIEDVLDEVIIPNEPVNENYPCDATMYRQKL